MAIQSPASPENPRLPGLERSSLPEVESLILAIKKVIKKENDSEREGSAVDEKGMEELGLAASALDNIKKSLEKGDLSSVSSEDRAVWEDYHNKKGSLYDNLYFHEALPEEAEPASFVAGGISVGDLPNSLGDAFTLSEEEKRKEVNAILASSAHSPKNPRVGKKVRAPLPVKKSSEAVMDPEGFSLSEIQGVLDEVKKVFESKAISPTDPRFKQLGDVEKILVNLKKELSPEGRGLAYVLPGNQRVWEEYKNKKGLLYKILRTSEKKIPEIYSLPEIEKAIEEVSKNPWHNPRSSVVEPILSKLMNLKRGIEEKNMETSTTFSRKMWEDYKNNKGELYDLLMGPKNKPVSPEFDPEIYSAAKMNKAMEKITAVLQRNPGYTAELGRLRYLKEKIATLKKHLQKGEIAQTAAVSRRIWEDYTKNEGELHALLNSFNVEESVKKEPAKAVTKVSPEVVAEKPSVARTEASSEAEVLKAGKKVTLKNRENIDLLKNKIKNIEEKVERQRGEIEKEIASLKAKKESILVVHEGVYADVLSDADLNKLEEINNKLEILEDKLGDLPKVKEKISTAEPAGNALQKAEDPKMEFEEVHKEYIDPRQEKKERFLANKSEPIDIEFVEVDQSKIPETPATPPQPKASEIPKEFVPTPTIQEKLRTIGINDPHILENLKDFNNIADSEGKIISVLENFAQIQRQHIVDEAKANHEKYVAKGKNFMQKLVRKSWGKGSFIREEEMTLKNAPFNISTYKKDLEALIHAADIGPNIVVRKEGVMEKGKLVEKIKLVSEFMESMPGVDDAKRLAFNEAASALSNLSEKKEKWNTDVKAKRAIEQGYEEKKKEILTLLASVHGEKKAQQLVNNLDYKVSNARTLKTYPNAEEELRRMAESTKWERAIAGLKADFLPGALSFASGAGIRMGTKSFAVSSIGALGAPLAALGLGAAFGAIGGYKKGGDELGREEEYIRLGLEGKTRSRGKIEKALAERAEILLKLRTPEISASLKEKLEAELEEADKKIIEARGESTDLNFVKASEKKGAKKGLLEKIKDLELLLSFKNVAEYKAYAAEHGIKAAAWEDYDRDREIYKNDNTKKNFKVRDLEESDFQRMRTLWAEKLSVRLEYTKRKLDEGKIAFGETREEAIANKFELMKEMGEATALLVHQDFYGGEERVGAYKLRQNPEDKEGGPKTRRTVLDKVLLRAENTIKENRKEFITNKTIMGAIKGGTLGIAGYRVAAGIQSMLQSEVAQGAVSTAKEMNLSLSRFISEVGEKIKHAQGYVASRDFNEFVNKIAENQTAHVVTEALIETAPPIESIDASEIYDAQPIKSEMFPAPKLGSFNEPAYSVSEVAAVPLTEEAPAEVLAHAPEAEKNIVSNIELVTENQSRESALIKHYREKHGLSFKEAGEKAFLKMREIADDVRGEKALPWVHKGQHVIITEDAQGNISMEVKGKADLARDAANAAMQGGKVQVDNIQASSVETPLQSSAPVLSPEPFSQPEPAVVESAPEPTPSAEPSTTFAEKPPVSAVEEIKNRLLNDPEKYEYAGLKSPETIESWANRMADSAVKANPGLENMMITEKEMGDLVMTPVNGKLLIEIPEPDEAPLLGYTTETPQNIKDVFANYEVKTPTHLPKVLENLLGMDPRWATLTDIQKDKAVLAFFEKYAQLAQENPSLLKDMNISSGNFFKIEPSLGLGKTQLMVDAPFDPDVDVISEIFKEAKNGKISADDALGFRENMDAVAEKFKNTPALRPTADNVVRVLDDLRKAER